MKKQNSFISSSSSVTTSYSSWRLSGSEYDHSDVTQWTIAGRGSPYSVMTQEYDSYNSEQSYSWTTYESTCYERIEYFLEAKEKLGEPYSKSCFYYQSIMNYSANVATENIYNGFVDLVITLPCDIRLAGIELINPWVSERFDSTYSSYWRYLPSRFNIYKVNTDSKSSETGEYISYENDIANNTAYDGSKTLRPIKYNKIENDDNLTLLGSYQDINWKQRANCQCFFKYNPDDEYSKNAAINSNSTGTATWNCKQLVIRIFETKVKLNHLNKKDPSSDTGDSYIKNLIYDYILAKELEYGTTYAGSKPTRTQIKQLYGRTGISSAYDFSKADAVDDQWNFGGQFVRSYAYVKDIKFKSGIDYKLGRNSATNFSRYFLNFRNENV